MPRPRRHPDSPRPARRPRPSATPRPAPAESRHLIFGAAAELFSARGFDGVGVDDIAHAARLNKAMIYYHFDSKLALYREIVRDMLRTVGDHATQIASSPATADARLATFIARIVALSDDRPWFLPLLLREISEGAPRLDPDTLALQKIIIAAFARILGDGCRAGLFRPVPPVLAYLSIVGPLMLNAARERAAARPGRLDLPLFALVPHDELTAYMQHAALRLLSPEPTLA